jgi:2-C-methyl-D-erythritol 2,4-cyclodiphosphate synthase
MRIGHGFDVHRFGPGDHLVIGGVRIPWDRGVEAHSDGDVLIHALCDAILGALAAGDIGGLFPDDDPRHRDADSRGFLREVAGRAAAAGYVVANCDATIVAQAPRMAPHIDRMRDVLAADLDVAPDRVSVKATTTERLGPIGRGEGIAAYAVVLLAPR